MVYTVKINSRKHIFCEKDDPDSYYFLVRLLIETKELKNYLNSNFILVYNRNKVAIVEKNFALSKETIYVFYHFSHILKE